MTPPARSALELGRLMASGELDPVAVFEDAVQRAEAASPGTFITLTPERGRAEAQLSAARLRPGTALSPLDGVPIAWKDLIDVAGTRTTAASATLRDAPPADHDAPVVQRLTALGMVCVGKTNLSELAYSGLGLNPHFGTPANPLDAQRVPGGSSSGSAVAVAAGVVPVAIGTDTSGSIRIPSAFCGLVGFRPSNGAVDRSSIVALSPALDSIGPLATTVADAVAITAALAGGAAAVPTATPLGELTIVVPDGELVDDVEPDIAARFAAAVQALAGAGARIVHRPVPAFDEAQHLTDTQGTIVGYEASNIVHPGLFDDPRYGEIDARVRARLDAGREIPRATYDALMTARTRLMAGLIADLDGALVAYPTVRTAAPLLADVQDDPQAFAAANLRALRSTMVTSFLDLPGISLPLPGSPAAGLLLSGVSGTDAAVAAAALAAEPLVRAG